MRIVTMVRVILVLFVAVWFSGYTSSAQAVDFSFSGFSSITAGTMTSGSHADYMSYHCPCFLANYEYAGVYSGQNWSARQESLVGVQGIARFGDKLSATMQVVARDEPKAQASIDWAYLTYNFDSSWSVQAGRKRLPIYYYSDSNYIGYSYIWVRPPVDVYGWDIYSYDGANVMYRGTFGKWGVTGNVWAGNSFNGNDAYYKYLYTGVRSDSAWHKIVGGYLDVSDDVFGLRIIYQRNKISETTYDDAGVPTVVFRNLPQQIIGAAFNIDYDNWIWRSEFNMFKRHALGYNARSYIVGGGYRLGDVTGMLTYSRYYETTSAIYTQPQRDNTRTVTVRWDFHPSMALKFQLDNFRDHSQFDFTGNGNLVTVSFVTVF